MHSGHAGMTGLTIEHAYMTKRGRGYLRNVIHWSADSAGGGALGTHLGSFRDEWSSFRYAFGTLSVLSLYAAGTLSVRMVRPAAAHVAQPTGRSTIIILTTLSAVSFE